MPMALVTAIANPDLEQGMDLDLIIYATEGAIFLSDPCDSEDPDDYGAFLKVQINHLEAVRLLKQLRDAVHSVAKAFVSAADDADLDLFPGNR